MFRKLIAVASLLLAAASVQAQQPYQAINPPQPTEGGKVEVTEFFWYGCPHCFALEPDVAAWTKKVPADVVFKRVPAVANPQWEQAAMIFYTLEAMGLLEQYHQKVFEAYHKDNQNLAVPRIREEWLKKVGIDVAKFNDVAKSFSVSTKVNRAKQMTNNYKVDSVPRVFVGGKYYATVDTPQVFTVVNQLVDMARKESGAAAPAAAPAAAKK
jgi:thiol:disulfide interchange protein DsbA